MRIKVHVGVGFPTATQQDFIEVDDDLTDEEINEEVMQWAWNYIDFGWEKV